MVRFRVPDQCTGLDLQYGASYRKHRGVIEVHDEAHVRAIRQSWPARHGLLHEVEETAGFRTQDPGNDCPACGFSAWSWQRECPRCGAQLSTDSVSVEGRSE